MEQESTQFVSMISSVDPHSLPLVFVYNQHFVAMLNIINAARLNPPAKGHKHHIIPRCWFKMNNLPVDNSADNLVLLTYEDHVKVHKLAIFCSYNSTFKAKMSFAYYRLAREASTSIIGIKFSDEHRRKISESNKGKSHGKGIPKSEEWKKKVSEAMKGKARRWLTGKPSNAAGKHWHWRKNG